MLPIRRVVVHRDGAVVERQGALPVVDGLVEIRRLPLLLDESSLRVEVTGADLHDVRLAWDLEGEDRAERPQLLDELAEVRAQVEVASAERRALDAQRRHVAAIAPDPSESEDLPAPERLAAWARLGEVLDPWVAEVDERMAELDRRLEALRERLGILEWQASQLSSEAFWARWAPTRIARVRVGIARVRVGVARVGVGIAHVREGGTPQAGADSATGEVEVRLSYRIPGATWTPAYTLESDGLFRKARFAMRALVVQATGEDWSKVELSLSTAGATRHNTLPELPALRLGTAQAPAPSAWRALPGDLDDLFPEEVHPAPPRSAPASESVEEERVGAAPPRRKKGARPPPPQALPAAPEAAMAPAPPAAAPRRSAAVLRSMMSAVPGGAMAGAAEDASDAPVGGAALSAPSGPEIPPEVHPRSLDYGRMRLAPYDAPMGLRGRLRALDAADELADQGRPAAAARLRKERASRQASASRVPAGPLPAHHVLPGPIDGAHYRFDTGSSVDVPADGRFHSVAVFSEPIELTVRYRTVPRLDPRAFRLVSASLERSTPLLPGPVEAWIDGSLVLTTPWKGTPGRGVLELGLGVEDGLKVVRNVRYDEESVGIFGGGRRLLTTVEVEIASSLPREARIEVLDRVPVPVDDDAAKVEITTADPPVAEYTGERDGPILRGGRKQVVSVPPGGHRTVRLAYAVTVGAKDELVGGDRRG